MKSPLCVSPEVAGEGAVAALLSALGLSQWDGAAGGLWADLRGALVPGPR